jgi:hypothetical protein
MRRETREQIFFALTVSNKANLPNKMQNMDTAVRNGGQRPNLILK